MNLANAFAMEPTPAFTPSSNGGQLVSTDGRVLPLERSHLGAEAAGGLARVTLEQRFRNPYDSPLLVTYQLPLPQNGAVSGFSFRIGETLVVGEVDRKQRAKERFEEAIASGKTAALLEQDRSSLFTQQVGNIPPGQEIVCEVIVDQPLTWLPEGAWEWRFPTVVGPRYMGEAGQVSDARAIATTVSSEPMAERLTLALSIDDELAAGRRPDSPSHPLRTSERVGVTDVCFHSDRSVRLDRDVVVRWQVARPEVGVTVEGARPSGTAHGDRTYGLLTVVPPKADSRRALPRDLIFLIDTSGSMGGRPLDQAKRVVSAMIDTLDDHDRIELIEFGSRPVRFRKEPVAATRNGRREAIKWVRKLRASGATRMHEAVLAALEPLRPRCQRQVVLITDGFIGFETQIIGSILKYLPDNCRLHTIGVGSAPNRSLTGPAARAGAGVELVIGMDEDAESVAARLLARTTAPLVTDLRIEGAAVLDVRPERLPDLFADSPVLVSVALSSAGGPIRVRGTAADGTFEREIEAPELLLGQGNQAIAALYGREWVEDLEMHTAAAGNTAEKNADIERIGLDFQIATRLTSWVAITEEATVRRRDLDPLLTETVPHEIPYGTNIAGFGLRGGGGGAVLHGAQPAILEPEPRLEMLASLDAGAAGPRLASPAFKAPPPAARRPSSVQRESRRRRPAPAKRDRELPTGQMAAVQPPTMKTMMAETASSRPTTKRRAAAPTVRQSAPSPEQAPFVSASMMQRQMPVEAPAAHYSLKRRSRLPMLLAIALFIAAVALGLWFWLGGSSQSSDEAPASRPVPTSPAGQPASPAGQPTGPSAPNI